ncbi:MAG: hypothetical protein JO091_03745 [Acidobacteriaceae bacterium]|nr:hypothetical protein [Acidobacteriaceae bacterium]
MAQKKNPAAVALAKKRAEALTPERRKEIAQSAIKARWAKAKKSGIPIKRSE